MAADLAARSQELGDGDALALAAGYAADDVVSDFGVERVLEPEERQEYVALALYRLLARVDASSDGGRARGRGEAERLADRQVRQVVVVLWESLASVGVPGMQPVNSKRLRCARRAHGETALLEKATREGTGRGRTSGRYARSPR